MWSFACQRTGFSGNISSFFKLVSPVCVPAPSLYLGLCKEVFVADVALCVHVLGDLTQLVPMV